MGKVQVAQQSVGGINYISWDPDVKPKIHCIDRRRQIKPNSTVKNTEVSEVNNEQNAKRHYLATPLSLITHIVALAALSYMIAMDTDAFLKHPTGTTVEDEMYSMEKIDFPGVAICNMNIMDRKAVQHFVDKLWANEEIQAMGNMTRKRLMHLMKYLGHSILFEDDESVPGDIMLCDKILKIAMKRKGITRIMEELSPKCEHFMKRCSWIDLDRECLDLFTQRWTQDGYCCTFNYVRLTDSLSSKFHRDFKLDVKHSHIPGRAFGLSVHMRPGIDQKFYNILPGNGFKALIFKSSDYPDAPSGGSQEVLVRPGSVNHLTFRATSVYSTPRVMKYDKNKRNCLFDTELDEIYHGFYSYGQCMMLCRVRKIYRTCGCVPFFYPVPIDIGNVPKCKLPDLTCLKQHRYKWWSFKHEFTELNGNSDNDNQRGDSDANSDCDCLPTCKTVYYSVVKSSYVLQNLDVWNPSSKVNTSSKNDVILSLSFEATSGVRLRQHALFRWYDLLSNYGGLCSLFLGITFITPIEFLYVICVRLWSQWRNKHSVQTQHLPASPVKRELGERPIYWEEIMSPVESY